MTAMTASKWELTPGRVQFMTNVYRERVAPTDPDARQLWENIKVIGSEMGFKSMINALKMRPLVSARTATPPVLPELATEDGLYRDPQTGLLYRVNTPKKRNSWDRPSPVVSVFSRVGTQRRLTVHDEKVKGTWKRFKAYESRMYLTYSRAQREGRSPVAEGSKILKSWFMTQQDKMDYKYGICMFCMRGLEDERSVRHNYGPVCADREGLPWND